MTRTFLFDNMCARRIYMYITGQVNYRVAGLNHFHFHFNGHQVCVCVCVCVPSLTCALHVGIYIYIYIYICEKREFPQWKSRKTFIAHTLRAMDNKRLLSKPPILLYFYCIVKCKFPFKKKINLSRGVFK